MQNPSREPSHVVIGPNHLAGLLVVPPSAKGLVIFAHGSGSGRFSPRNNYVARRLEEAGFATLLPDLLTEAEEKDRTNVFDIQLLSHRLQEVTDWAESTTVLSSLPIGYFGASTGGGAALMAAAAEPKIKAVVSRGGRPDLAASILPYVQAPTLLLVGSHDPQVLDLNRAALAQLRCEKALKVIPNATHLFEEPGTLDLVVGQAIDWFGVHLMSTAPTVRIPFRDRRAAGQVLAGMLERFRTENPLILALPRGGVPVAFEVATALDADLDLLLVRKLGAPGHEELGIGAIIDGANPQIVLNERVVGTLALPDGYIQEEARRQLAELERRRSQYMRGRPALPVKGRTVILVDDGVATGSTVRAALRGARAKDPRKLVLAVPVAPRDTLDALATECDEVVCAATPEPFYAVGAHYHDFTQTSDQEVEQLLDAARRVDADASSL